MFLKTFLLLPLLTTLLATPVPAPSKVAAPLQNDIFYLTSCPTSHSWPSQVIYFSNSSSPHPSTEPSLTSQYTTKQTWADAQSHLTYFHTKAFNILIQKDVAGQPPGALVGTGTWADLEMCKDTGYSVLNCYVGDGKEVWGGCVGEYFCVRAGTAVC
ncbi:hypothetical protein BGZ60DRAFT_397604 [Tricladium varicosporioides]|nr:hypothetical protein BGZ60DRAFT_397604 [Hymenoscyphus varicosporioides]